MSAAFIALSLLAADPVLLDGVAAQVGRKVITRSDVQAEARMFLVQRVGEAGLSRPVDDRFLSKVLDYVVVQELLAQRARRDGVLVPESEVDRGEAAFQARFSSEAAYRRFLADYSIGRDQIRAVVRRDGAAGELLRRRRAGRPIIVDDAAVDVFLSNNPDFAGDAAPGLRHEVARQRIIEETLRQQLTEFLRELKGRTEVRVVAFMDGGGAAEVGPPPPASGASEQPPADAPDGGPGPTRSDESDRRDDGPRPERPPA